MATIVQAKGTNGAVVTSAPSMNFVLDGDLTNGSSVYVIVSANIDTTIAVSDAVNGAYTEAVINGDLATGVYFKHNITGGTATISVTLGANGTVKVGVVEATGSDTGASPTTGTLTIAGQTQHFGTSDTNGVTGNGVAVTGSNMNTNTTWTANGTDLFNSAGTNNARVGFYKNGSHTAYRGDWTVGAANTSRGAFAFFPDLAGTSMAPGVGALSLVGNAISLGFTINMPDEA
jgi:hypothetical protein